MKKSILIIALLAAAFAAGLLAGRSRSTQEVVEVRDTLTFHDTVMVDRPVPVYVSQIRTDTVRLALVDSSHTTLTRDSATVTVPITRKVYQDSTFRAVVSGYKPSLDSLWVYNTTREIETMVNASKQFLTQKSWHDTVLQKGPALIMQLNPEMQVEAEQAQKIASLESKLAEMERSSTETSNKLDKVLALLAVDSPRNSKSKKED